ncbi:MAG: hypothetical protein ACI9C1_000080 [Candidatus Aldehydirespiratoraceae bacterium]|jgi:hypothetical protein
MTTKRPFVTSSVRRCVGIFLSVVSVAALTATSPVGAFGGFSDVASGAYYADAVTWMADEGITIGTEAGCFSPDEATTRGQAMTFLWRYEYEPSAPDHNFIDVTASYQQAPVSWGQYEGITTGVTDSLFKPNDPVTRADAVVFLWRMAGSPTHRIAHHGFSDVTADYQQDAVSWARAEGITTGVTNSLFDPNRSVSRGEISTFLYRYDGENSVSKPAADVRCSSGGSPATGGGDTTPPTPTTPPSDGSGSNVVSLGLNETNTGLVGGQNAGKCSTSIRQFNGNITINDSWLAANNAGSKTLTNFDVNGSIVIRTNNVTLRCGSVSGSANYTVDNQASGTVLEWFHIYGSSDGKALLGGNYTAYRCDISGGEDSVHINTGAVTITECYIHDQNYIGNDPHPDAIQATSGGTVENVTVIRSKLTSFYKAPNAALQINVANSFSITDSYLWGGLYSILGDPGNPGVVTNNYFAWGAAKFGAIGGVSTTRSGNVWWEWISPRCSGTHSAPTCATPSNHPGNGTPI